MTVTSMLPRRFLPAAATLVASLLLAACATTERALPAPSASAGGIVVGDPSGEAFPIDTPSPTPLATPPPTPPPSPTIAPAADGFSAVVAACGRVSSGACQGQLSTLDGVSRFVALVSFSAAKRGDTIEAVLEGPSGPLRTGPYALQGGGSGYYYAEFALPSLAPGTYTLTALRNGSTVAQTVLPRN
jgi:hypothetical protein